MKPICLIPARSGSKGLPNKNMLFLEGKPMIFHTIDAAIESGCFAKEDIYVSTDSPIYKEICETRGIRGILRPKELSSDFSTSYDVNEHFLKDFPDDQVFVLLQVTSPLRTGENIKEAMALYETGDADNVVSFSKVEKSPKFFAKLDEEGFARGIEGVDKGYRRQNDKEEFFAPNGAIYITSKSVYLKNKSYFTDKTKAYIMKKEDSIDVDDRLDFTNIIGRVFFDYHRREKKNKPMYQNQYSLLSRKRTCGGIILGDNRLQGLEIEGFDNFSMGGVTFMTMYENMDTILSEGIQRVVLSLGINDLISGYSMEEVKQCYAKAIDTFLEKKIEVILTDIIYTLFRDSISNQDILAMNQFLQELAAQKGIAWITLNDEISNDHTLTYAYTRDGLHLNALGEEKVFAKLTHFVKEAK